jgi:hypothetical protein
MFYQGQPPQIDHFDTPLLIFISDILNVLLIIRNMKIHDGFTRRSQGYLTTSSTFNTGNCPFRTDICHATERIIPLIERTIRLINVNAHLKSIHTSHVEPHLCLRYDVRGLSIIVRVVRRLRAR